jgi:hypothetical protein
MSLEKPVISMESKIKSITDNPHFILIVGLVLALGVVYFISKCACNSHSSWPDMYRLQGSSHQDIINKITQQAQTVNNSKQLSQHIQHHQLQNNQPSQIIPVGAYLPTPYNERAVTMGNLRQLGLTTIYQPSHIY